MAFREIFYELDSSQIVCRYSIAVKAVLNS